MRQRVRERRGSPLLAIIAVAVLVLASCGGRQSTASKSAAAYREAQARGTPVGTEGPGNAHGGAASTDTTAGPHENHQNSDATGGAASAPGHNSHGGTTPVGHAAMGHEITEPHSAHESGKRVSTGTAAGADGSMAHHPVSTKDDAGVRERDPATERTQLGGTLRPDEFDAASPASVSEAAKASAPVERTIPPDDTQSSDHSSHAPQNRTTTADRAPVAAVYTCPMHPEVTSATQGKCPKCGMALVKKEKR